jgi:hypothetical protein
MSEPHKNIHRSTENAKDLHAPHGIAHYNSGRLTSAENSGNHVIQLRSTNSILRFIQTQRPFPTYCSLIPESEHVGWILGYHSASLSPSAGQGRGDPNPPTCAYIYLSVDLLYSAIESSFPTDRAELLSKSNTSGSRSSARHVARMVYPMNNSGQSFTAHNYGISLPPRYGVS